MLRLSISIMVAFLLASCSFGVYTHGVGVSVGGLHRASLKNDSHYAQFINTPVFLVDSDEYKWTLRKSSYSRHIIERSDPEFKSTEEICSLAGKKIVITDIFRDHINGGIYYRANVSCDAEKSFDTRKNQWYGDMVDHIKTTPPN